MQKNTKQNKSFVRIGKWLGFTAVICAIGCLWIWRGNEHERITARLLTLERLEDSLLVKTGNLRQELIGTSDYSVIEKRARNELGMVSPGAAPDTVWITSLSGSKEIGTMSLLKISFRR